MKRVITTLLLLCGIAALGFGLTRLRVLRVTEIDVAKNMTATRWHVLFGPEDSLLSKAHLGIWTVPEREYSCQQFFGYPKPPPRPPYTGWGFQWPPPK